MENQVRRKKSALYAFKVVGDLGHDNKLFDRTCPVCRGMYSSHKLASCPKCNSQLVYITGGDGQPMAISEGTIYPALSDKQIRKDNAEIYSRKNGMRIRYRFKMFSFVDEHGVLTPPAEHSRCCRGAKVELLSMNHQPVPSWFMGKDHKNPESKAKVPWVEFLVMVYTNYGDYVKVLTEQEYASMVVHHEVNSDGSPAPVGTDSSIHEKLAHLQAEINKLQGIQQPQITPDKTAPPWSGPADVNEVNVNVPDPFKNC